MHGNANQMSVNPGSFRDPFGCVFSLDGKIYRSVFAPGVSDYEAAKLSGVFDKLTRSGILIGHEEVEAAAFAPDGTVYCLEHPKLPFVSYPWEWSFSMLKDAALLHIQAMEELLPEGFWLRDASAFNAQFDGMGVRLIDTLSVGRKIPGSPWVAYGQFCSHFLASLAMAAYGDVRTLALWRGCIDGIPLDLAVNMLPLRRKYQPGLFMHLTLHSSFQNSSDKKEDIGKTKSVKNPKVSDRGLIGVVHSLKKTINSISWKRTSRVWEEYAGLRTYGEQDVALKGEFVETVVKRLEPKMVWDLGANTGEFSLIAASHGAFVVSIDGDPACTEHLYQCVSREPKGRKVLPLTMDLANPSPALGWNNSERSSLSERGPADLVLALALLHHLVLSACVPLSLISEWLSQIAEHALVEYVPPEDPMVRKLLANRNGEHLAYDFEVFQSAFQKFFSFLDEKDLLNGRKLYLCKRKQ